MGDSITKRADKYIRRIKIEQFIVSEHAFGRPLVSEAIPKACGFEAATHFLLVKSCGSLISIVVIGMGMEHVRNSDFCILIFDFSFNAVDFIVVPPVAVRAVREPPLFTAGRNQPRTK
jgi:hypothetical protein